MQRFKPKVPLNSNQVLPIDRIFQCLLGIIIVGVVYRYCWIGILRRTIRCDASSEY